MVQKLLAEQTVTYLALGDSVTAGVGVDQPATNCFPALLARALGEQFPGAALRLVNAGEPGITMNSALTPAREQLATLSPDLVTLQYGGNDSRIGTQNRAFRYDLDLLARATVRAATTAVLCVPPLEDKFSDAEIAQGLYSIARSYGLPVADLETALKRDLPDFRGPFPWGEHPNEHAHVSMAREVYRVLCQSVGLPTDLSLRIERGSGPSASDPTRLPLTARVEGATGSVASVSLTSQVGTETKRVPLGEGGVGNVRFELPLSGDAPDRTQTTRAWVAARQPRGDGAAAYAFDLAWLSVAPVLRVNTPDRLTLTSSNARFGADSITDEADLSAEVAVDRDGAGLRVEVAVSDDSLNADNTGGCFENDCVELFFDVRGPGEQGAPYYSRGVLLIFIVPAPEGPRVTWIGEKPFPPGWERATVTAQPKPRGYSVELRLPLPALRTAAGEPLESLGFDVAIDDADDAPYREAQLMWAGSTRNHLIPSEFGGLDLRPGAHDPVARVTVH